MAIIGVRLLLLLGRGWLLCGGVDGVVVVLMGWGSDDDLVVADDDG